MVLKSPTRNVGVVGCRTGRRWISGQPPTPEGWSRHPTEASLIGRKLLLRPDGCEEHAVTARTPLCRGAENWPPAGASCAHLNDAHAVRTHFTVPILSRHTCWGRAATDSSFSRQFCELRHGDSRVIHSFHRFIHSYEHCSHRAIPGQKAWTISVVDSLDMNGPQPWMNLTPQVGERCDSAGRRRGPELPLHAGLPAKQPENSGPAVFSPTACRGRFSPTPDLTRPGAVWFHSICNLGKR